MPFFHFIHRVTKETLGLYWDLIKIMVPVMIAVRIATQFGLIDILAAGFRPLMDLANLPPEMGLVWATACLVNLYGAAGAYIGLLPQSDMTVAQVTVLGSMMLVAHTLPVEQRVCQKAGANILTITALRLGCGLLYGVVLSQIYAWGGWLTEKSDTAWLPTTPIDPDWPTWIESSLTSLFAVLVIVFALVVLLRLMDVIGATKWLTKALTPALRTLGIGPEAAPLTMVGILLGLSYGGALIIREARAGHLNARDIFLSLALMGLCHAVIEDTLFIAALGAHWSGIFIGRIVMTVIVISGLSLLVRNLPDKTFERLFFRV